MTLNYILMIFFYWLFLTGTVFLSGAFISRACVTAPSGADVCLPSGKKRCLGETASRYILYISLFALIINAVHLIFHASIVTETPLNEVFSIISPFLTKTKYGRFTIWRSVFLFALIVVSLISLVRETRWSRTAGVVFSLILLIAISMSGHQGVKGYINIPFFLDVLHLIAISIWIGGLFLLRICFSFLIKDAGVELLDTCRELIKKFSDLATYCVYIAIITGILLSLFNIKGWSILTLTDYGLVLIVKFILVGIILILGGVNKFFFVPLLNISDEHKWSEVTVIRKRIYLLVSIEVFLGFVILLATSILTHLSPEE